MLSELGARFRSWRMRMRTDRPNLWHPIRAGLMIITTCWMVACMAYTPPRTPLMLAWNITAIALLLLSSLFPKSTSVLFLVIAEFGSYCVPGANANSLPGILYALGLLSFETSNLVALLLFAFFTLDELFNAVMRIHSNTNPVAIIAMMGMVALFGCALRWNEMITNSRMEAEQAKARLREMESRNRIAEAIHDAVTGDLSAAVFVAQRHTGADSDINGQDAKDWKQINDYVRSALANVHRVIDELDMDITTLAEDDDGRALFDLLCATMDDGDRRLRTLGFDITSVRHVAGGKPSASPAMAKLANGLLREIYANIARHAQPGSKVDLSVMLKPNAIEITQINLAQTKKDGSSLSRGHGLAYFGKQLESYGGKLTTTLHDDDWTLFAYLPAPTSPPPRNHHQHHRSIPNMTMSL